MQIYDMNCYAGHWPFRRLRRGNLEDVRKLHKENNIIGGIISSLDSVFYNDPQEGEAEFAAMAAAAGYGFAVTINPMLPAAEQSIHTAACRLYAQACKIFPGMHRYNAQQGEVRGLCQCLQRHKLPLLITVRMEDERLEYLYQSTPVNVVEFALLAEEFPQLPIVLCGCKADEICAARNAVPHGENLFFDTSGIKNNLFAMEKLVYEVSSSCLLYGSQAPLYCLKSSLYKVVRSTMSADAAKEILYTNSKKVFGE